MTNPFSTRFVKPGAIQYCFGPRGDVADGDMAGGDVDRVIERLRADGWRGAIVGPHGSGKSTLLATLIPAFQRLDINVRFVALHDRQKKLPAKFLSKDRLGKQLLVIVDGYEQLSRWRRWRLASCCRRRRWGLLITAHSEQAISKLPIIFRTAPDLKTVQHLIDCVLPSSDGVIQSADVAAAFHQHRGNVREVFFALYDVVQQRRSVCQTGEIVRL
jgi:hypothetical protein